MTIWAILDPKGTIINIVDDLDGRVPPFAYVDGQTQIDMKQLPKGTWTATAEPSRADKIIAEIAELSPDEAAKVADAIKK